MVLSLLLVVASRVVSLAALRLDVYFINVGHGDAILIDFGEWECLIDAGDGSQTPSAVIRSLLRDVVGDGVLEVACLSHNHADHFGGFSTVFQDHAYYRVGMFWRSGDLRPDWDGSKWRDFEAALSDECPIAVSLARGAATPDSVPCALKWKVLLPSILSTSKENDNENSLVLLLTYGSVSFLFAGDLQTVTPATLEDLTLPTGELILKAPHHGRHESATLSLVQQPTPSLVVVSTDDRVPETATEIVQRGIPLLSTSSSGTIRVSTDGETAWVTTSTLGGIPSSSPDH